MLLYISFAVLVFVGILNYIAGVFYLYWTLWWFDNIVHFLGGVSLGFFSLYLSSFVFFKDRVSFTRAAIISFVVAMIASGAWELFEYIYDPSLFSEKYDTLHDLIADAIGAILAFLLARRFLKYS